MVNKQIIYRGVVLLSTVLLVAASHTALLQDVAPPVLPAAINGIIQANNGSAIQINGQAVPLNNAVVSYAGQQVSQQTLVPGMRVQVQTLPDRVVQIRLQPAFAGEISAITNNSIALAGVQVQYKDTAFYIGDFVLISADPLTAALPQASAVVKLDTLPAYDEIEGRITALDVLRQQFSLGNILVDYSSAGGRHRSLQNGSRVEVFGRYQGHLFNAAKVISGAAEQLADTEIRAALPAVINGD